jgi:hypothetical protein
MEEVIRQHLGWLVVWGNVFGTAPRLSLLSPDRSSHVMPRVHLSSVRLLCGAGGIIGLISQAVGYGI